MKFYCALNETEAVAWQDGEQHLDPDTGEIVPIGFIPTFACEWDGVSPEVTVVYGSLEEMPDQVMIGMAGSVTIIPAHMRQIPFAGWPCII